MPLQLHRKGFGWEFSTGSRGQSCEPFPELLLVHRPERPSPVLVLSEAWDCVLEQLWEGLSGFLPLRPSQH